jgi:hypothetical protein
MAMREMIFGEPPDFDDVLAEIERFQSRLNSV